MLASSSSAAPTSARTSSNANRLLRIARPPTRRARMPASNSGPLDSPQSLWATVHRLAVGEAWPPSTDSAADRLVRAAAQESLLPLLFEHAPPPAVVRGALDRARAWQRVFSRRADVLDRAIVRVGELLRGEPFLFLKGADYRNRLYARTWLRPMQDIDVLVPAGRVDTVVGRLRDIGRPQLFPGGAVARLASYHERVFDLGEVRVESHHSFIQRIRYRVDYEGVWNRRASLSAGTLAGERLGDADALLYHAISLANDEFAAPLVRFV